MKVGDKLWYVPTYGKAHEVTVEKIGRKWFTVHECGCMHFSIETLYADGVDFCSPGRCFSSRGDWEQDRKADELWLRLWEGLWIERPEHLCCSGIRKIAEILRIKLD